MDVINFQRTLSNLWTPKMGVNVEYTGKNRFLVTFFHYADFMRIWNGIPWTFNNKLIALRELNYEEDSLTAEIISTPIWVQIERVPRSFISAQMCETLGRLVGELLEIDKNNFKVMNLTYLRVRVQVAIKKPIKKKMTIRSGAGKSFQVEFQYEIKAPIFLPNLWTTRTFRILLSFIIYIQQNVKCLYDQSIKASVKRRQLIEDGRYLRDPSGNPLTISARVESKELD